MGAWEWVTHRLAVDAELNVDEVTDAVSQWRSVATDIGNSRGQQEAMSPAFRFVEQH